MIDQRPKIAALVADAFQEEEYFFPKVALNEAGYRVEVVSSRKEPVEIYSYFARTGLLDVERLSTKPAPRTMWASSFQVAPRAPHCWPRTLA